MKTGTLQELNVQPGDVVEWTGDGEVGTIDNLMIWRGINGGRMKVSDSTIHDWRIISRAPRDDTPKLWRDMTAEEKGALLLAALEGKVIEYSAGYEWEEDKPEWHDNLSYRVKPDDVVETVVIYTGNVNGEWAPYEDLDDTYRITFDIINGEPDPTSIRMERI